MTREYKIHALKLIKLKIEPPTDNRPGWLETWIHKEDLEAFDSAIKALEQEQRWIPVSERLPENKERVLVSLRHFTGVRTVDVGSMVFLEGIPHWHVPNQRSGLYEVEAWMPLPEPYKEESEPQESEGEE